MFLGVVLGRVYAVAGSFGRAFGVTLPVAILTIASLQGCAGPKPDVQKKSSQMVWPTWPDQPRFAFQTVLGTEASIVPENPDQRLQRMLTGVTPEERKERIVIGKPSGIAVREGRVYVTDPAVKAVTVLDASRKKIYRFGLRAPNTLERPQSVALDANSWVYVLDTGLRQVMVFDALGLFKYSIAVKSGFTSPVAVAVNPDGKTVYVVDRGDLDNNDHKVVAFDPDGKEKFRIGPRGQEGGQFNIPLAATVSPDGTLLVADAGNARIQAFDSNGKFKFTFGGFGAELGRFSRPRSIATDSEGNIYVADAGFNNVQVFNAKGELLMPIGQLSQDPGPGNYSLIGVVAIDDDNRLYVTDNLFRKIDVFRRLSDEEGKKILATTDAGSK
jgi:DNA-binding beta-propeller fold protein YncE